MFLYPFSGMLKLRLVRGIPFNINWPILYMLASTATSLLPGNWPQADVPPAVNPDFVKQVDLSKIRKVPTNPVPPICNGTANDPFCYWTCTKCSRPDTDVVTCPNQLDWGLSFDDGPTEVFTNTLLDYLETQNVKVTFFAIGSRVIQNPQVLQKAFKAGHQIGVHTWSHPSLTNSTTEQIITELKWTETAIKAAVNVTPKYFRPPFGDYDDRVRDIATQLGYKVAIWDLDTNDWMSQAYPNFDLTWIEGNFTQWVNDPNLANTGHISLEHDLYEQTAARVPLVVPILKTAKYNIKPIASCIGDDHPYQENVLLSPSSPSSASSPAATNSKINNVNSTNKPTSDATKLFTSNFWLIGLTLILFGLKDRLSL
ncbi:485_t:CDS:2 [Dentiscutata erythropus]|uniref:485_t:CDS:1 n=1 Tax=Dentiscutata erythropus TaxID=1348616 RepID=A0A9N9H8K5_9GLOM|nr:485_t:CDS:2 [Dentiscutata erythropus]